VVYVIKLIVRDCYNNYQMILFFIDNNCIIASQYKKILFMNKLVLLSVFTLLVACKGLFAQDLSYGVKAGMNISNFLSDDNSDEYDSKAGINIGAFLEISFSDKFSIQPELMYSGQGSQQTLYFDGEEVGARDFRKYKYKFDYLNIPVLAKYYVMDGLSIQAGPQLGVLLSADDRIETDNVGDGEVEIDITSLAEPIDFSFDFGIGYEFGNHLLIDARYNVGLTNVVDSNDETLKNSVFQFSVGYKF
jgi:hypothetical protein